MVPPKGDIFVGSGNFQDLGQDQLRLLIRYAGIQPHHRVLDIGSGIGRTAVSLTSFLDASGSYEGFDIVKKGIKWCQENIATRYPNFQFQHVSIDNDLYHKGSCKAIDFVFPYNSLEFDLIFLFSVFTHMQPPSIDHYLSEICRVMKVDARCLVSLFLYTSDEEEELNKDNDFSFPIKRDGYRLMDEKVLSANVALDEDYWNQLVAKNQLNVTQIVKGYWIDNSLKSEINSFQDIVILERVN